MTPSSRRQWFPSVGWRPVLAFAALVIVLLGPWPGYGRAFGVLFSAYGNRVARALDLGGSSAPRFAPPTPLARRDPAVGDWVVTLSIAGADGGDEIMPLDARILGYTPLAIFLALTMATPIGRRRKLKVLALGLVSLLARLAVAIALPVGRALGAASPGWTSGLLAEVVWWVLIAPPVMSYATPLLAWWVALAITELPAPTRAVRSPVRVARTRRSVRRRPTT
jgi:hypothetical protein